MNDEVIFTTISGTGGDLGLITLNRPKALNALSFNMADGISRQLRLWAHDDAIKAVAIIGNGDKAFCAGGDIKAVHSMGQANSETTAVFFNHEYRLNHQIKTYPKPYISLVHGITMGGGIGLSIHGSHRVASPDLVWAMPETGIGFFPDVGASFFLSRCQDHLGLYLGLTGTRLPVTDAIYAGLIDHCIPREQFSSVIAAIAAADFGDKVIDEIIKKFAVTPIKQSEIQDYLTEINHIFSAPTIADIFANVQAASQNSSWAANLAKILATKSPTSLSITFTEITKAHDLDFAACMNMEFSLSKQCLATPDFYEGIRAAVIDKDNAPVWQPATIAAAAKLNLGAYFPALENWLGIPITIDF